MSRFSAFAVHLGISFVIFLVLAYFIVFQWYPGMFFDTDGGWRGMRIIFAVDLVLGPLLTLIVYKAGKPGLKFDLAVIAFVQFSCLTAGTYIVYDERPLAVVFSDGRFTVMSADEYRVSPNMNVPDLELFPGTGPKWVMLKLPDNIEQERDLRAKTFKSGRLMSTNADLYIPFSRQSDEFINSAVEPTILADQRQWKKAFSDWTTKHGGTIHDYRFYTFSTRYNFGYLVFDKETNEELGLLTSGVIQAAIEKEIEKT